MNRLSVCMAVFNGAAYLRPQLESIVDQLGDNDEIIVVDDGSTDDSAQIIHCLGDTRCRLHQNRHNIGVLACFERALRLARGEVIFLSDQDDIWLPGKVERVLQVFNDSPQVTLVVSDARVIDENGTTIVESFFAERGRFRGSLIANLIKNKHLGCTMAFRRTLLERFLPIPHDVPMHDIWFGLVNAMYGKVVCIDEPLIAYRRHRDNLSPMRRAPWSRIALWRLRLVKNLALRRAKTSARA